MNRTDLLTLHREAMEYGRENVAPFLPLPAAAIEQVLRRFAAFYVRWCRASGQFHWTHCKGPEAGFRKWISV